MVHSCRGVIFVLLLLIFVTNLKETKSSEQDEKETEETEGQSSGSSLEDSGSGKIEDNAPEDEAGSENTTVSPRQGEKLGTEEREEHGDYTKEEESGSEEPTEEIGVGNGTVSANENEKEETKKQDENIKDTEDSKQPTEKLDDEQTSFNKTSLDKSKTENGTLSDSKDDEDETKTQNKDDEENGGEQPTEKIRNEETSLNKTSIDDTRNKNETLRNSEDNKDETKEQHEDDEESEGEQPTEEIRDEETSLNKTSLVDTRNDNKTLSDSEDNKDEEKQQDENGKEGGTVQPTEEIGENDDGNDEQDKDKESGSEQPTEEVKDKETSLNETSIDDTRNKNRTLSDEDGDDEDGEQDKDETSGGEQPTEEVKDKETSLNKTSIDDTRNKNRTLSDEDEDDENGEQDKDETSGGEQPTEEVKDKETSLNKTSIDDTRNKNMTLSDEHDEDGDDEYEDDKDGDDEYEDDEDGDDKDEDDEDGDDKDEDDEDDKDDEDGKTDKNEKDDEGSGKNPKTMKPKSRGDGSGEKDCDSAREGSEQKNETKLSKKECSGNDTQPTEIKLTEIKPTEIKPTKVTPTKRTSTDNGTSDDNDKSAKDYMNKKQTNEKAKKNLQERSKNIDAKNKTQIQTVLASFKQILSSDKSNTSEPSKLEDDIMAVKSIENVGKTIASQLKPTSQKPASVGQISDDQVFGVVAMNGRNNSEFSFPDMIEDFMNVSSFPARVQLPSVVLNSNTNNNLSLVFMIYTASSQMKSQTGDENFNVTGKVVLVSIFPKPKDPFQKPVVITIQNQPMKVSIQNSSLQQVCVFLMENSSTQNTSRFGAWSEKGCELAYRNTSHSVCHCYHLTNFAILTRFSARKIAKKHELPLSIITYIGLMLSIFGCLATLIVHLMLPRLWTDRAFIHMNLVTALGIANFVFLFQKVPDVGSTGCTTLALILLYFYLTAFSWMMLEGIHIYRMLVQVFESGKDPRKSYFVAGWGFPMLLVMTTIAIFRDDATSEYYCWLSATNGALWMFAGPVCLVIFINTLMLLVVLKTSFHHAKHEKHLKRSMAKTFCVLLPVLGLTWLIGIITFNKDIIEMQYIFAILNSLQGFFIFLFYVVYSQEVRREISHRISIWKTAKEIHGQPQVTRDSKLRYSEQLNSLPSSKAWMYN